MDVREKLNLLGEAARYDDCRVSAADAVAEGRGFFAPETGVAPDSRVLPCVSHLTTPWGERKATLKVLQTSSCQNNCNYCMFRAGRDIRRAHLTPDELARSFDLMYRAGLVESMFLSSGVMGTNRTMDEMLATVELARLKYNFRGYIHLKLLPGAEAAHIQRAVELADRVSANLEAPTGEALAALAPMKVMPDLVGPLRTAGEIRRKIAQVSFDCVRQTTPDSAQDAWSGRFGTGARPGTGVRPGAGARPAPTWGNARLGLSTQFVVGPAGESDQELLTTAQMLYREIGVARAYYSAFSPVKGTPLENTPPTDPTPRIPPLSGRLAAALLSLRRGGAAVRCGRLSEY